MAGTQSHSPGGGWNFELYRYDPSLAAAVVTMAIFLGLTIVHIWRLLRARSFYFIAFTTGGLFQTLGYGGRIWSHFDNLAVGGFVIQAILILVAPALYAASIYMILGRLIKRLGMHHASFLPVTWITRIFVTGDVVTFSLQAGGGGIQAAGTLELFQIGERIIIAGLFCQIVMFGFFVVTTIIFHSRINEEHAKKPLQTILPWQRHLYVLYATSVIILIRSVFRVVEYLQGNDGYLISHEAFLYCFDAFLMAMVMTIFALWYVGDLTPKRSQCSEDYRDPATEVDL